jgi:hypothetical protein
MRGDDGRGETKCDDRAASATTDSLFVGVSMDTRVTYCAGATMHRQPCPWRRGRAPPPAARLLTVRGWQTLALASAVLLLLAPAAVIIAAYQTGSASRLGFFLRLAAFAIPALALAAALLALQAHGPLARPEAVLVWKTSTLRAVPTDAGEQKVTATLPAGTVARIDKVFLGWRRLVLPDGNTGWVRTEPLVSLWQAP